MFLTYGVTGWIVTLYLSFFLIRSKTIVRYTKGLSFLDSNGMYRILHDFTFFQEIKDYVHIYKTRYNSICHCFTNNSQMYIKFCS